jgi:SAM-dependent methyltransferase
MRSIDRRATLRFLFALLVSAATGRAETGPSNFRAIYGDPRLRKRFYLFLTNVFHLYPEDRFHRLITDVSRRYDGDEDIYTHLQGGLHDIKPLFSELRYALPALAKQKEEMARQTRELLGTRNEMKGYVEIGSPGRYVRSLRRQLPIDEPIYVVHDRAPALSLEDIIERGQVTRAGTYVPLDDYDALDESGIPPASVDLVTNYIGFHHAPAERLEPFMRSIWRVLRPGGRLVVRDHDVDGEEMRAMVALAHDVFNAGVKLTWAENHAQIRNFTSVPELERRLAAVRFERVGDSRFQEGDPTRNALMVFVKAA